MTPDRRQCAPHTTALIGLPPLRQVFDLEPIEPRFWPLLAAFPPLFLAAEELRKLLLRRWQSRSSARSRER